MNKARRRFTLLELIALIAMLAILASFAYPRLAMVEVEARKALVLSLGSSVNAAARQAHFLWLMQGKRATIDMEGQAVTMLNGYPDKASIDNTLMDYSGFQYINAVTAKFRKTGATAPNTCMVTYADAVADSRPAVTAFTSGC